MNLTILIILFIYLNFHDSFIHAKKNYLDDIPFLWGAATAAYQIEGGFTDKGKSIWDDFAAIPGKIKNNDNADIADDSYHLYETDVELLKKMNVKSYRFSISWTRILPSGRYPINEKGVSYYNQLINALIAADIIPMVTLFHWDYPTALFQEYGAWLSTQSEEDFTNYASLCFSLFGDRVKIWATMNEPWTSQYLGWGVGIFAPGRCSDRSRCNEGNSSTEVYISAHNLLNAHASAVERYREYFQPYQGGVIGIVLNLDWGAPLTDSQEDILAANRRNEFTLSWFADPIYFGHYPKSMEEYCGERLPKFTEVQRNRIKGSTDYFGLNHYTAKYIQSHKHNQSEGGWDIDQQSIESVFDKHGKLIGIPGDSSWLHVVPWAYYELIMWVTKRYSIDSKKPVILLTENGCDVPNENNLPIHEIINDQFRINYYQQYLQQVGFAIRDGAVIKGYYAWSLLDNFEWADGFSCRFGLTYVNFTDPNRQRIPKNSSKWYKSYIQANEFSGPSMHKYEVSNSTGISYWYEFLSQAYTAQLGSSLAYFLDN